MNLKKKTWVLFTFPIMVFAIGMAVSCTTNDNESMISTKEISTVQGSKQFKDYENELQSITNQMAITFTNLAEEEKKRVLEIINDDTKSKELFNLMNINESDFHRLFDAYHKITKIRGFKELNEENQKKIMGGAKLYSPFRPSEQLIRLRQTTERKYTDEQCKKILDDALAGYSATLASALAVCYKLPTAQAKAICVADAELAYLIAVKSAEDSYDDCVTETIPVPPPSK